MVQNFKSAIDGNISSRNNLAKPATDLQREFLLRHGVCLLSGATVANAHYLISQILQKRHALRKEQRAAMPYGRIYNRLKARSRYDV